MSKLSRYISNLSKSDAQQSSKRFIALYVAVVLISFVVFRYTDKNNIELVLVELIGCVLGLLGIGGWEKRNREKYHSENDKPK